MIYYLTHLSILFFVLRAFSGEALFIYLGTILGIIVFALQVVKYNKIPTNAAFLLIFLIAPSLISLFKNNMDGLLFYPQLIACIGVAWAIHTNGINKFLILLIFYLGSLYYLFNVALLGVYRGDVFANSSNYVSVNFINLFILLSLAYKDKNFYSILIPASMCFVVSIFAQGFGGILSSFILLSGVMLYPFSKINYLRYILIIVLLLLFLIFYFNIEQILNYILINYYDIIMYFGGNDSIVKLNYLLNNISDLSKLSRIEIWLIYINSLDLNSILFGSNMNIEIYFEKNQSTVTNLHNSYLLLHQRIGLFSIIFIILLLYSLIMSLKNNFLHFVFLVTLLTRGFTDTIFFAGSSFDFVILYLILFSYKLNSSESLKPLNKNSVNN